MEIVFALAAVVGINLVADRFGDVLDPRAR